jgi:hypothetical protein
MAMLQDFEPSGLQGLRKPPIGDLAVPHRRWDKESRQIEAHGILLKSLHEALL